MGDVYQIWMKCKLEISKLPSTSFSTLLLRAMKQRELNLLENDIFVSCVYLDPRINVLLSEKNKDNAKKHLQATWNALQARNAKNVVDLTNNPALIFPGTCSSSTDDDLEMMLKEREFTTVASDTATPKVRHDVKII